MKDSENLEKVVQVLSRCRGSQLFLPFLDPKNAHFSFPSGLPVEKRAVSQTHVPVSIVRATRRVQLLSSGENSEDQKTQKRKHLIWRRRVGSPDFYLASEMLTNYFLVEAKT